MAQAKVQFAIEFDPFENYVDVPIDDLSDSWKELALEVHGENEQIRKTGVEKLKVKTIDYKNATKKKQIVSFAGKGSRNGTRATF